MAIQPTTRLQAEQKLQDGDLSGALSDLQAAIRNDPANVADRVFLFQLLCVMGDWDRALTQLNIAAELDNDALLMAQAYRELLHCEAYRSDVFAGLRAPLLFGEPPRWIGPLIQALGAAAEGDGRTARSLVNAAFEAAPTRGGTLNGTHFDWIADADMRLGPVIEAIINGKYYWVPMDAIEALTLSEPQDLRDLVWLPAQFTWINGGTSIGFIPSRYPGATTTSQGDYALSRKTEWIDIGDEFFIGVGQKMLTSNESDFPLLQARQISFDGTGG